MSNRLLVLLAAGMFGVAPLSPAWAEDAAKQAEPEKTLQQRIDEAFAEVNGYLIPVLFFDVLRGAVDPSMQRVESALAKARARLAALHQEAGDYTAAEALLRAEAERLLSQGRREEVAGIYLELVEAAMSPEDATLELGKGPDHAKALRLLEFLLEMELPPGTEERVHLRRGQVALAGEEDGRAQTAFRTYLERFDPLYRVEIRGELPGTSAQGPVGRRLLEARLGYLEAALREESAWPDPEEDEPIELDLSHLLFSLRCPAEPSHCFIEERQTDHDRHAQHRRSANDPQPAREHTHIQISRERASKDSCEQPREHDSNRAGEQHRLPRNGRIFAIPEHEDEHERKDKHARGCSEKRERHQSAIDVLRDPDITSLMTGLGQMLAQRGRAEVVECEAQRGQVRCNEQRCDDAKDQHGHRPSSALPDSLRSKTGPMPISLSSRSSSACIAAKSASS